MEGMRIGWNVKLEAFRMRVIRLHNLYFEKLQHNHKELKVKSPIGHVWLEIFNYSSPRHLIAQKLTQHHKTASGTSSLQRVKL